MSYFEMILAIKNGKISKKLIEALTAFYYNFDPFGMLEEYGYYTDKKARAAAAKEIKYILTVSPDIVINDIAAYNNI